MAQSSWDIKSVNRWWGQSIQKERARHLNKPSPHKGDRFSVPTDVSNFAKPLKKGKQLWADQRDRNR